MQTSAGPNPSPGIGSELIRVFKNTRIVSGALLSTISSESPELYTVQLLSPFSNWATVVSQSLQELSPREAPNSDRYKSKRIDFMCSSAILQINELNPVGSLKNEE